MLSSIRDFPQDWMRWLVDFHSFFSVETTNQVSPLMPGGWELAGTAGTADDLAVSRPVQLDQDRSESIPGVGQSHL